MAKYDSYTLSLSVGTAADNATLTLSVLLEDGDAVGDVLASARTLIENEAVSMKEDDFLKNIKQ